MLIRTATYIAISIHAIRNILGKALSSYTNKPNPTPLSPRYPGKPPIPQDSPLDIILARNSDGKTIYFASARDIHAATRLASHLLPSLPADTYIVYEQDDTPDETFPPSGANTFHLERSDLAPPIPDSEIERFNRALDSFR